MLQKQAFDHLLNLKYFITMSFHHNKYFAKILSHCFINKNHILVGLNRFSKATSSYFIYLYIYIAYFLDHTLLKGVKVECKNFHQNMHTYILSHSFSEYCK